MVSVTLGTGVGGGIIINGSIVGGVHGAGGEIGHMKVSETETETCGCGKRGCLEQYASATGIVRLTKQRLAADDAKTSLRSLPEVTAKDVLMRKSRRCSSTGTGGRSRKNFRRSAWFYRCCNRS